MKQTPLYQFHHEMGAQIVDFAGFQMPLRFSTIAEEHLAVRNGVGLFDVSHMGNFLIKGKDAAEFLDHVLTNDHQSAESGQLRYSHMLDEMGRIIDDMICAREANDQFLAVPNASMIDTDLEWFRDHAVDYSVTIENFSDKYGILALQGPKSTETLSKITDYDLGSLKFFRWGRMQLLDLPIGTRVWKSGYTGEMGYEIMVEAEYAGAVWNALLNQGVEHGIKPVGLGARDTLRMEKGLLLSGTDFNRDRTTLETNWVVPTALKWDHDFIGKSALEQMKEKGDHDLFIAFNLLGKGVPRHGYEIRKEGEKVGVVTSGTMIPGSNTPFGLGYIRCDLASEDTRFDVEIRGKEVEAAVINIRKKKKKKKEN